MPEVRGNASIPAHS